MPELRFSLSKLGTAILLTTHQLDEAQTRCDRMAIIDGGRIIECEPTEAARIATLREVCATTGAVEIHPFDNDDVIAGAATAALELIEDSIEAGTALDAIYSPLRIAFG